MNLPVQGPYSCIVPTLQFGKGDRWLYTWYFELNVPIVVGNKLRVRYDTSMIAIFVKG